MSATSDLLALLQRHYIKPGAPMPGGIFLPEVGWNPAGGPGGRAGGCDAIYVGFTSSSGRLLIGHELKVSRSDWLNELNKPGKADAWADQCHQWWLVVLDPSIVHDGELPPGWGLMSPGRSKTRMTVHVKADTKTDHRPSWLAVRSIMARQDTLRAKAIENFRRDAREDARREFDQQVAEAVDRRLRGQHPDVGELRANIAAIEDALGAKIDFDADSDDVHYGWAGHVTLRQISEIAEAVRVYGDVQRAVSGVAGRYASPIKTTQNALDRLGTALGELAKAGTAVAKPESPGNQRARSRPAPLTRTESTAPDLFSEVSL
ncbi:hypothetical protein [Mycolicibacterium fortuitum]|uniref:hypothetical protein n=1 Tax=Mycolicibacterium fortuitum TaxID=1766 RepID=UPI00096C0CA0|nr:hypothetical protein [Mycolicibacterium fortuitum]OMC07082.1 hypothetical protein A5734_03750 [Mycolicibacterium fortuitum]